MDFDKSKKIKSPALFSGKILDLDDLAIELVE